MRLQLLREDIEMVGAVIITHTHADHIMGMDDLRSFTMVAKKVMPIYAFPGYLEDLRRVFEYAFADLKADVVVPQFGLHPVPPVLEVAGLTIQTFTVMHGPWPVVGVRVNDFAHLTDLNHIPPEAEEKLQGLKVLVMDAVRIKPHTAHFPLDAAIE